MNESLACLDGDHCWHYNERLDMDQCCECFRWREVEEVF